MFNKLAYSVKNAKIVISKAPGSTALLYATLYKKPIIMVFSNEVKANKNIVLILCSCKKANCYRF